MAKVALSPHMIWYCRVSTKQRGGGEHGYLQRDGGSGETSWSAREVAGHHMFLPSHHLFEDSRVLRRLFALCIGAFGLNFRFGRGCTTDFLSQVKASVTRQYQIMWGDKATLAMKQGATASEVRGNVLS
jgi:hypothetical protein